jgi:MFS family permease
MSRDLKIVSAAMLTWGLGEGMFYIFQPLYIQQFGADPVLIGTILGINGLVMTVGQIPAGLLADKIGRRPLMWASWVFGLISTWIMALAPSLGVFVVGLLLYGITSSVMSPLNSYIQDVRGTWQVGRALTFTSAAYNIGAVLGPVIGGMLGEQYNLRSVYYVAGAIFAVSTTIIFFAGKDVKEVHVSKPGEVHILKNKRFRGMVVMTFLVMFAALLPQSLAANFLQNQRGLSLSRIGQLGALGGLGSAVLMLVLGHLPAGIAMLIGQAGMGLFSVLLWQGTGLFWYGAAYLFLGGYRLIRAMTLALVQPAVRAKEIGLAFGIVETVNSLAFVVAPILAGFLYDWRPISIFPVSLGVLAVTVLLTLVFTRWNETAERALMVKVPVEVEVEVQDEA